MPRGCVIFDFDGVIADTESLHLQAYNHAFAECSARIGGTLEIEPDLYFHKYIVYGDREGFFHMLRDAGRLHDDDTIAMLCKAKDHLFNSGRSAFAEPLPGVIQLLAWLEERNVPRAICSGAKRSDIEHLLQVFGVAGHFELMTSIEDVRFGKPDPEGYNLTFDRLNERHDLELSKSQSLVIEDSPGGCEAGKAAGIPVLGVATSIPLERVERCATYAVRDLSHLDFSELSRWLRL